MLKCLVCESENLKGRIALYYDAPLAKRDGAIKTAGLKVGLLDVREAWEKLNRRPVWCWDCMTEHVYDTDKGELLLVPEEESGSDTLLAPGDRHALDG